MEAFYIGMVGNCINPVSSLDRRAIGNGWCIGARIWQGTSSPITVMCSVQSSVLMIRCSSSLMYGGKRRQLSKPRDSLTYCCLMRATKVRVCAVLIATILHLSARDSSSNSSQPYNQVSHLVSACLHAAHHENQLLGAGS